MAKPRIFISSTFFDLRQVRADLDRFVKELGYDTVRNETGGIPYGKDQKLEDYCYKEISEIDILVGIVGGRFGSEAERGNYSITQVEIKTAIEQNKQVYVFIEKNVLAEYQTYLINKDNETTKYRFVEDKKIYKFIEEIYALPKNNIVHPFETALDITFFLREQWAGLFRDLLHQQTKKVEYDNISQKVSELNEVSSTLQTYLENVLKSVSKEKIATENLIVHEKKRLENFQLRQRIKDLDYPEHLIKSHDLTIEQIIDSLKSTNSLTDLKVELNKKSNDGQNNHLMESSFEFGCMFSQHSLDSINQARIILGLAPYKLNEAERKELEDDGVFTPSIIRNQRKTTKKNK
jgi:hypothetical protein